MVLETDGRVAVWREHKYVGGPPKSRIQKMQYAHETRARQYGVRWEMVDLRRVYERCEGRCGICRQPVSLKDFTIDHIVPLAHRGAHVFDNLQIAHQACNSAKGDALPIG